MIIRDGAGTGYKVKVDSTNRMHVQSVSETAEQHSVSNGNAYNINTGSITFSAAGTFVYIKNNEDQNLFLSSIAIAVGAGTVSDSGEITITANPTGGDLISDATAISINQNRNIGSSSTLVADVYKGKSGGTLTGGSSLILVYNEVSTRRFIELNFLLPKGNSIGISYDPKLSSGSQKGYCNISCHLVDMAAED